jgi:putative membrane-bound dehydrogenase-like protein
MNPKFPRLFVAAALALNAGPVFAELKTENTLLPASDSSLPKVAKDWKVELVGKPPQVQWPSVVEVAPDGRIFIGEHGMDMPGPAGQPIDRVLCIHPDGRTTVFADHLYAVFALRYIDGKLFVHQSPKFTVFTDDNGVGKDPVNIIDSTYRFPDGNNLNDHIPANVRLGMDNFLYLSTGDKGVFGAKSNVDGSTAEIHGGGVARIRPDGRDLQVYSTGTRNHLDVALNSEDEIFTYDNTDDGLGWWTRYTHMVDGGYYGYPHDYRPEESNTADMAKYRAEKGAHPYKPWTLWRIDESGGGSACGAVGYNEDALPAEYHGNTFHCEWGKGRIQRFAVERDGGTYKITKYEDLLGGGDFHPLGISVTADGTGFYVADWQEGGWHRNAVKGRLLKLTYTGEMHPTAKPAWYIPAAQGQKFEATLPELIAGLSHPAECVRLVAQRRVAEHGKAAVEPLVALLNDAKAPAFARWHAIWTLDLVDGGKDGRGAILAIAKDDKADLSVRMQAVRELGTRAAPEAVDACVALLSHESAAMCFRAATALGRIGSAAAVPALTAKLDEKDFFTHFAVFTALNRIGRHDPNSWSAIVKGFASSNPRIREGTGLALHETFDKGLVDALAAFVASAGNGADGRAAAVAAIAPLHRAQPKWDGRWWGTQPQRTPAPAKTLEWDGTPIVLATIQSGLKDSVGEVRTAAIEALEVAPDPKAAGMLVDMFNKDADTATRKTILHALAAGKSEEAMSVVETVFKDPSKLGDLVPEAAVVAEGVGNSRAVDALIGLAQSDAAPAQRSAAFDALAKLRAAKAVPALAKQLDDKNIQVAIAAADALGRIGGAQAAEALSSKSAEAVPEVRKAVVVALGTTQDPAAIPALLEAYKQPVTKTEAIMALTHKPDLRAVDAYVEGLGSADAGVRVACRRALEPISAAALSAVEARLDAAPPLSKTAITELQRVYSRAQPIIQWHILGPFAEETPDPIDPQKLTSTATLPEGIKSAGKTLQWQQPKAGKDGYMDLYAALDPHDHVYAYATAEVESTERDVELTMGSDDGLALWVNGEQVYKDLANHGWTPDEFHAKAHLKAGKNVFAAKITQDGGPWGFSVAYNVEQTGKLFTMDMKSADPKAYDAFAIAHEGDAAKGGVIFHNATGVGCIKCHKIGNDGGNVGPELGSIGMKYNRAQIIESVLYPSKQIAAGYEQTLIRTKDGNVQSGVVRGETDTEVTLFDSSANKIVVRKADIDVRKTSNVSVMPDGLQAGLTPQQFADLIAYLQSLKEAVKK